MDVVRQLYKEGGVRSVFRGSAMTGAVIRVIGIAEKKPAEEICAIEYCGVSFLMGTVAIGRVMR
jgi:hypothetical protein